MLQHVQLTARSWARRFLDQLQEAAETAQERYVANPTVPQLTALTRRRNEELLHWHQKAFKQPMALAELIDVLPRF